MSRRVVDGGSLTEKFHEYRHSAGLFIISLPIFASCGLDYDGKRRGKKNWHLVDVVESARRP